MAGKQVRGRVAGLVKNFVFKQGTYMTRFAFLKSSCRLQCGDGKGPRIAARSTGYTAEVKTRETIQNERMAWPKP